MMVMVTVMKGVYVLIVSVNKDITLNIGALGNLSFKRGLYAYVGSAQSCLEKRLKRHLRRAKRRFWHIDFLLESASVNVVKAFYKEAEKSEECEIAVKLNEKGVAVANFGCSDCNCVSHLFRIKSFDFLKDFMLEAL